MPGRKSWKIKGGMNQETQSIIVALLGGLLLSITLSGRFTSYVRPGFKPLLLIGGGVLVAVGVLSLILAIMADVKADKARKQAALAATERAAGRIDSAGATHPAERSLTAADSGHHGGAHPVGADVLAPPAGDSSAHDHSAGGAHDHLAGGAHNHLAGGAHDHLAGDAHGHDHSTSKAPWLILLPVLVLLLVAPPALGADAVARNATSQGLAGMDVVAQEPAGSKDGAGAGGGYKFNDGSGSAQDSTGSRRTMHFPPLDPGANPPVQLKDFILRALYDADNSVKDTPVTVTGFIAPAGEGYTSGYTIARIVISCCAADANPMQLHVDGDPPFPVNTWVDAVVTVVPDTATMDNGYVPVVTLTSATSIPQPDDPYEH